MTQHEYKPGDKVWIRGIVRSGLVDNEVEITVRDSDHPDFGRDDFYNVDNIRPEPLVDIDAVVAELERMQLDLCEIVMPDQSNPHHECARSNLKAQGAMYSEFINLLRPKPKTAEDVIAECLRGTKDDAESITEALRAEGFKIVREDA